MDQILARLNQLAGPSSSTPATPATQESLASSSEGLPKLLDIRQDPNMSDQEQHQEANNQQSGDSEQRSPIIPRIAGKRKAPPSSEEESSVAKKIKTKHRRAKSSSIAERQTQRNQFTAALTVIPDWFPDTWNFAAYITNRFFWVHEAARFEMYQNKKTKGQNYPCYRVPFNNLAIKYAKEYDDERKSQFEAQSANPDLLLVHILPWYKMHSPAWKRPMIHPRSAKTSTEEFAFHTNIKFMDNFLKDLGGKFFYFIKNKIYFP